MTVVSARIPTSLITDWNTFHSVFASELGFPDFYGENMNAWIDCMTYFDDEMTRFTIEPGGVFHLEIADSMDFAKRMPEVFQALLESAAFVNTRRIEEGLPLILSLILL